MTACIDGINKVLIGARYHGRPTLILEKMVYGSASAIEMRSSIDAEIRSKVLADLSELTVHVVREFDVFAEQQRRTLSSPPRRARSPAISTRSASCCAT